MKFRHAILLGLVAGIVACGSDGSDSDANNSTCTGKCDGENNDNGSLLATLDGRNDPIAAYLRDYAGDSPIIEQDYRGFLDGMIEQTGCAPSTEKTFVILMSRRRHFPRNIVTLCSDDPAKASEFFMSTQSDVGGLADINAKDYKAVAWDATARKYNLYEFKADSEDGPLFVDADPQHCASCHTEPTNLEPGAMPFTPIMNELTNPWTLWNAEPEFRSHRFDELIDPDLLDAPVYSAMTEGEKLGAASQFESIMRSALEKTVGARLRIRRNAPNVEETLGLLRPMFCDESVNYASENHDSGEISTAAIVDDSMRHTDWAYDWINDGRMRLDSVQAGETPLAVMPVRGEAALQVEVGLVTRRALTPYDVLRLRSIDWQRPVFSEFRCDMYRQGSARILADPPDTTAMSRNSDLVPVLFAELMKYEVYDEDSDETVVWDFAPEGAETVYDIPDVTDPSVDEALFYGLTEDYETDVETLATNIETYFDAMQESGQRSVLEEERRRRGCFALANYPSSPDVPDIGACAE